MKISTSRFAAGKFVTEELLATDENFMNLSIELENGVIMNLEVGKDHLLVREGTYRKLTISPQAANTVILEGVSTL